MGKPRTRSTKRPTDPCGPNVLTNIRATTRRAEFSTHRTRMNFCGHSNDNTIDHHPYRHFAGRRRRICWISPVRCHGCRQRSWSDRCGFDRAVVARLSGHWLGRFPSQPRQAVALHDMRRGREGTRSGGQIIKRRPFWEPSGSLRVIRAPNTFYGDIEMRQFLILAVLAASLSVAACNTVAGAGKDVKSAGTAVTATAEDAKK